MAAIKSGDLSFGPDDSSVIVHFVKRKNDQYRQGSKVTIIASGHELVCPVRLINVSGFFRHSLHFFPVPRVRWQTIGELLPTLGPTSGSALSFSQYRRYLSLWFGSLLGLSPDEFLRRFGTHSGRIRGASAAPNVGVAIERWGQHGSWHSASAQRAYMQLSEENILNVSRVIIMAYPSTHDVREHGQGDDDSPNDTDNGESHPEVEGAPTGFFRWSN